MVIANNESGIHIVNNLDVRQLTIKELPIKFVEYVYNRDRKSSNSPYQNKERDAFLHDVYTLGYENALLKHGFKTKMMELYLYKVKELIRRLLNFLK